MGSGARFKRVLGATGDASRGRTSRLSSEHASTCHRPTAARRDPLTLSSYPWPLPRSPPRQRQGAMRPGEAPRSPSLGRAESLAGLGDNRLGQSMWGTATVVRAASSSQVCCGAVPPTGSPLKPTAAPADSHLVAPGRNGARGGIRDHQASGGQRSCRGCRGARSRGCCALLFGALGPVWADLGVQRGGRILRLCLHAVRPIFATL